MKPTPSSETPLVNPNMTATGFLGTMSKKALVSLGNALLKNDKTKSYGEIARILSAKGSERDTYHNALIDALMRREAAAVGAPIVGDTATLAALTAAHGYLRGRSKQRPDSN
jgi:hypothetical protein